MTRLTIRNGDWVVVADGRKALLLENEGDETLLNLKTREVREYEDSPNRELNADRPGRVHQSASVARSSVEQTDRHFEAEKTFIAELSERLSELLASGGAKTFLIVAPARVLGLIRKDYSASVRAAIKGEIDHDLTHLPLYEIENRLLSGGGA